MAEPPNDSPDEEALNPFPDEAWIGCPHCEKPIDICAQIARARRDVGEFVLSLLFNNVPSDKILYPLEKLVAECMDLEDRVRRSAPPLSHLNVYKYAGPEPKEEFLEPDDTGQTHDVRSPGDQP